MLKICLQVSALDYDDKLLRFSCSLPSIRRELVYISKVGVVL